jgi:hypothetical protein
VNGNCLARRAAIARLVLFTVHGSLFTQSCGVSPLTNKLVVGEEAFVIAVAEGPDSLTDLFAAPARGGEFVRLTFNRAEERSPRLAPEGTRVAFLRRQLDGGPWSLVILDLQSNAERSAPLPGDAGEPEQLGWDAGTSVVVRATGGYFRTAPSGNRLRLAPVAADSLVRADSATRELLGPGGEGLVRPCEAGVCVVVGDSITPLGAGVSGAVRWGPDSVGYFSTGSFEVRPLSGGYPRRPEWKARPARLRDLSYHPGAQVTTRTGVSGRR